MGRSRPGCRGSLFAPTRAAPGRCRRPCSASAPRPSSASAALWGSATALGPGPVAALRTAVVYRSTPLLRSSPFPVKGEKTNARLASCAFEVPVQYRLVP